MNVLCIGDIVGHAGREALEGLLPKLKDELKVDLRSPTEKCRRRLQANTADCRPSFSRGMRFSHLGDHA